MLTFFSVRDDWAPYYIKTTEAVMDGTYKPADFWGGFKDDMLSISSINDNLPADVKAKIQATYDDVRSGKISPFTGPIKNNEGKVVVAKGHTLTDTELAQVNWYVEGITDAIPQ